MRVETVPLSGLTPGVSASLTLLHFGDETAWTKAYVQAGLHADEGPGMLCAHHLRRRLQSLEAEGKVRGHIVLAPAANPLGMSQFLLGSHHGRFALADGVNFNRDFPDLAEGAAALLEGQLTDDAERNGRLAKGALLAAVSALVPRRPAEQLKNHLLSQAVTADTVLDLHCDGEATMHLYVLTPQAERFQPLADLLGADALLTAEVSGGRPFDEAASRPWVELKRRFAAFPMPEGSIAATVELRGEGDVRHDLAERDAGAIIDFLALRGHLDLDPGPPAPSSCRPTPLEAMEALEAPAAGLVVYRRELGDQIAAGDVVAEIVDPVTGAVAAVAATTSGVFFARANVRFAQAGRRLGKIAGRIPFRSGALLSP